ncbi:hypothetical protein ACHAQE_011295, partial [Botrytis cinerea]
MRIAELVVLASALLGVATALSLPREERGDPTNHTHVDDVETNFFYKRTDDTDFYPFLASKSSIINLSTQPSESPPQDLRIVTS